MQYNHHHQTIGSSYERRRSEMQYNYFTGDHFLDLQLSFFPGFDTQADA
jgi:hypothetical protein